MKESTSIHQRLKARETKRMVKATLKLPNGTKVEIDGSTEEVEQLLQMYASGPQAKTGKTDRSPGKRKTTSGTSTTGQDPSNENGSSTDITALVNCIKECDEAEAIETRILDRTSQVDRTLLPLYIVHEHMGNQAGLTSGEINKITTELSVPIAQPAASRTLSGAAAKYVIADGTRKRGKPLRYKLSRRGLKYLKSVLAGQADE